jgi:hypothetical protein
MRAGKRNQKIRPALLSTPLVLVQEKARDARPFLAQRRDKELAHPLPHSERRVP